MDESVHPRNAVAQLAAEPLLGHALIESGDVGVGHLGVDGLARLEHVAQAVDAHIGYVHHRGVEFQLAAGAAGRGRFAAGQCIEDSGLTAVWEADNTKFHGCKGDFLIEFFVETHYTTARRFRGNMTAAKHGRRVFVCQSGSGQYDTLPGGQDNPFCGIIIFAKTV